MLIFYSIITTLEFIQLINLARLSLIDPKFINNKKGYAKYLMENDFFMI